jgi:glycosyltransferase involved in cell wall biosynthesis
VKVLMLGWEFPPYFAGGVGVVCEALTRSLAGRGNEISYVMPWNPPETGAESDGLELLGPDAARPGLDVLGVPARLHSYATAAPARPHLALPGEVPPPAAKPLYGPDLLGEVERFAARAVEVAEARGLAPDLIHAHDWTTFPAGIALRRALGKPLVVHVHITEFDKSGGTWADPRIYAIERAGMQAADLVVVVSQRVGQVCVERYGVDPARIRVVYNGVDPDDRPAGDPLLHGPLVLFLGRVTLQKGPDYFVEAARRVLDADPHVTFVLAGTGDMLPRLIERAAELGIGRQMLFPGFVDRERASALFAMADVFVMPSVSEPFGIVPLEAMDRGVPVIVSRQSGSSELLRNALKVDFWDVEDLAGKIVACLRYRSLASELEERGREEVARLSWDWVAERTEAVYREVAHG